jgi:thiosulfate/3-mercaptopyruvate sulfurtransferase
MKHLAITTAAAFLLLQTGASAETGFGPLITADALSAVQGSTAPLVVDIRAPDAFAGAHIAGSVNAPYALFRGPADNPGQLVPEDTLTEVLRGAGITTDRPTVVVYAGSSVSDFGAAARVYWTLKSSGVSQLAILNGGIAAWEAADLSLTDAPSVVTPSDITVSFAGDWLATTDNVLSVVNGTDDALLLDARSEEFWAGQKGHDAAAKNGTLPQSKYFEHAGWFGTGPTIVDAQAVRDLAAKQGFTQQSQIVSFCNTGHWAATNWFALSELAGIDNVKLYPESMVGWSNGGHEMANVPGLVENLINQVTGKN